MILYADQPPKTWTSDNAHQLRDFLESDTGKLVLDWLSFQAPSLLDGADKVEKTLVNSGEVRGYTSAVSNLIKLTVEQPVSTPVPTNYPDLDNDEAWADVDKKYEPKT